MVKCKTILLPFMTVTSIIMAGDYVPLTTIDNKQLNGKPIITVLKDNDRECVINVKTTGYFREDLSIDGIRYTKLELADDAVLNKTGYPAIPFVPIMLSLPNSTTLSIVEISPESPTIIENVQVFPAQHQWETKKNEAFSKDADIYRSENSYPENIVSIDSVPIKGTSNEYRRIAVYPCLYTPSKRNVTIYKSVTVTFSKNRSGLKKSVSAGYSRNDLLFGNIIDNRNPALSKKASSGEPSHNKSLLIIVPHNEYKTIVKEYADWKHISGIHTTLVTREEAGGTVAQIREYIHNLYKNTNNSLTDVMLVGMDNDVPSKNDGLFFTDNHYGCFDDGSYIPVISIGRLPVTNASELKVVMKKLLTYEKTPPMHNPGYYKKAIMCSNNSFASQAGTKRTVAAILHSKAGFDVDTLMMKMPGQGNSPSKSEVIAALSSGKAILNYRGEGWVEGWDAYGGFHESDLLNINNINMLTFVTSIGCGAARWTEHKKFGVTFLTLGTEQQPRGAVTVIGPVFNTSTASNNNIDRGIYKGLFNEGLETPGDAMLRGLTELYKVLGDNDDCTMMHCAQYTVLGDPSLRLYKDTPIMVTIEKPPFLSVGQTQCIIKVKNGQSGIDRAVTVCGTSKSGIYIAAKTNSDGIAFLNFSSTVEEMLTVVVKGNSVYPVIDSIPIIKRNDYCAPETLLVNDASGNNDGILNPNEQVTFEVRIKNFGQQTVSGISATLKSASPLLTLTNGEHIPLADIPAAGVQKISVSGKTAEQCSSGTAIPLLLILSRGTVVDSFTITTKVQACILNYVSMKVIETGNIGLHGRLDPGEKAKIVITINNSGKESAANVTGKLSSASAHVSTTDASAAFGTIAAGQNGTCNNDFFEIEVKNTAPANDSIKVELELTTNNGRYPYSVKRTCHICISIPTISDPTGPDSYGYSILSSKDSMYTNSPVYQWNDITEKGTSVPLNFDMNSARQIITLPFTFKFYGKEYTKAVIHANGTVSFDEQSNLSKFNGSIAPESDGFKAFISCLGFKPTDVLLSNGKIDGLDTIPKSELVYYNDVQNKQFIIQFSNITYGNKSQIILKDPSSVITPTGDGEMLIVYDNTTEIIISGRYQMLVGIENENETNGLTYYHKYNYENTAHSIRKGISLLISTVKPIFDVNKMSITINKKIPDPESFFVRNIYPNPSISSAVLEYSVHDAGMVSFTIFNAAGKIVKTFYTKVTGAGMYSSVWDGTDMTGRRTGTGVYFVQFNFNGIINTRQIIKISN